MIAGRVALLQCPPSAQHTLHIAKPFPRARKSECGDGRLLSSPRAWRRPRNPPRDPDGSHLHHDMSASPNHKEGINPNEDHLPKMRGCGGECNEERRARTVCTLWTTTERNVPSVIEGPLVATMSTHPFNITSIISRAFHSPCNPCQTISPRHIVAPERPSNHKCTMISDAWSLMRFWDGPSMPCVAKSCPVMSSAN